MEKKFDTKFIPSAIEKEPFSETPARKFFFEWCRINDSIQPQFLRREDWEKKKANGILGDETNGRKKLIIPIDLKMWEIIDILETVDRDTYGDNSEFREKKSEELKKLGETFQKAGQYLHFYSNKISRGGQIAENIARDFFEYGSALSSGEKRELSSEEIEKKPLSEEDKKNIDEWLLGENAFEKRNKRLEKKYGENISYETVENVRIKSLSAYFSALDRQGFIMENSRVPWKAQAGPFFSIQDTSKKKITAAVETPERELKRSIFRRGIMKLVSDMKEPDGWREALNSFFARVGINMRFEKRRLYDALGVPKLKAELEEAKKAGNVAIISKKEKEIAEKIQETISRYRYKEFASKPREMVENQFVNCVGASTLGGAMLDEIGINHLHGNVPEHAINILITSDNKAYWQDMLNPPDFNFEISDDDFEGGFVKDIVAFSKRPDNAGIQLMISRNSKMKEFEQRFLKLFKGDTGQEMDIVSNAGFVLEELGEKEIAIEAFRHAASLDTKSTHPLICLGIILLKSGKFKESLLVFQQVIVLDPTDSGAYNNIGCLMAKLGRSIDAVGAFRKAVAVDPKNPSPHVNLGIEMGDLMQFKEAESEFRIAVNLDPNRADWRIKFGDLLLKMGKFKDSEIEFRKALEIEPINAKVFNGIGYALEGQEKFQEAVKSFESAIFINPLFPDPYFGMGRILANQGRKSQAEKMYRKFIELWDRKDQWTDEARRMIDLLRER